MLDSQSRVALKSRGTIIMVSNFPTRIGTRCGLVPSACRVMLHAVIQPPSRRNKPGARHAHPLAGSGSSEFVVQRRQYQGESNARQGPPQPGARDEGSPLESDIHVSQRRRGEQVHVGPRIGR